MVRELDRVRSGSGSSEEISSQIQQHFDSAHCEQLDFPATAPTANPVFFRTYSRFTATGRETWQEVCTRTLKGLVKLGKLTDTEADIIDRMQRQVKAMPSGRWLWVGGSEWLEQPQNFSGAYNCTSTNVCDWVAFALMMDLAMMGCGTGAILEPDLIGKLPVVKNKLNIAITSEIGGIPIANRQELSTVEIAGNNATIRVGDSRQGWVNSYKILLELSSDDRFSGDVNVSIDLSNVRPAGEQLKGFGGMANPVRLPELYGRCAGILNKAIGRQLNSVECCLLIDEAAVTIVAGNIRRCLPAGALVHAESGLVPIEKVRIGDRVLTSKGFYPVTNFFDQGEQSLCRIKTQDSYFECTADHKVAVLTDIYGNYRMVKAKDLQPNDRLVFVPQAIPGTPTELPAYNDLSSTKNQSVKSIVRGSSIATIESSTQLQIPTLTSEVAYCLGYLTVNSILTQDGSKIVFFIQAETPSIIQRLVIFSLLFGVKTHHIKIPHQCLYGAGGFELEFDSPEFTAYLSQFRSGQIPDSVLHGTVDIRQAYLAGLGDAESRYSEGMLAHGRKNSDFLKQVQILYASLGIKVRNCNHSETSTQLIPVDYLDVEAIDSFLFKHSLRYVHDKAHNPKLFNVSIPQLLDFVLVNDYKHGVEILDVKIVPCQEKHPQDKAFLTPINVESIEMDVRTSHTYDIEVASIHEFVCEGILVSNSAGMRQFNASDTLGATAKDNLWQQDEHGNWRIDPERDSLRMANHTRVFHHRPTLEECVAAVQKQYYSGEGAIQWAGEAVARSNADLLTTPELKANFLKIYAEGNASEWFANNHPSFDETEVQHRLSRFGLNPCGEILGTNFHCNLSEIHLNQLDPNNHQEQKDAFTASALSVAALLNHKFQELRYQYSRELDPIVGVSFTGLFDFFVHAFGSEWLQWWTEGRPATEAGIAYKQKEHEYLNTWRRVVEQTVWEYCDRHGIKRPNRCTTVQPSGTKSLLTGASPGWHAPKAQRFIRRITFRKDDPVALACIDYGYSVIPSQSDKDENGNLLDDAYDPRCTEWLIEIPVAVSWADIPGADSIEIGQFSALAQMDFYMGVQQHYVRHNTSATIELREHEVDALGKRIYEAIRDDEGYISAALLARFDDHQTFPRLPFEPIDRATYEEMMVGVLNRRQTAEFHTALSRYDLGNKSEESGPAGCDSDKCLLPDLKPNS
jgi:ribonucleotide reductase, class II